MRSRVRVTSVAAIATAGLVAAASTYGWTYAALSDFGIVHVAASAGVWSTTENCTQVVDEPTKSDPNADTASCTVDVANHTSNDVHISLRIDTSSLSNNDQPVMYDDAPPTYKPPKADPKHGIPDYSENLWITDSVTGAHFDFGSLACPAVLKPQLASCTSTATTPDAVTLASGHGDTFTITVHLNHGGHNGSTINVDLDAQVGGSSVGSIKAVFDVS